MFCASIFLLLLLNLRYCISKNYSEYTLYRGVPINQDHLSFLKNLTKAYQANYWKPPGLVNTAVEFMIGPDMKQQFLRTAKEKEIVLTTVIEDVQKVFDEQIVRNYTRRKMETFDWKSYYHLKDIYNWMLDLQKSHPKVMKVMRIGETYENRRILAARISHLGSKKRSTVIVEGGIHAREWIAPAVVTYFMYQILMGPESNDKQLRNISQLYDFFFVPVLNPDGYDYTHKSDRAWRKNRRGGYGVDINRNFGIEFGTVGVSLDKKSEIYCGKRAFSENESLAMAQFIKANRNKIEYYLAFHSYGQFIILPYAYSKMHLDNYDEMKTICDVAAKKIKRRHNTVYNVGTAFDTIEYITSGVSGCWAKQTLGIPYVATFELPGEPYGFALPPNKIVPICMETMDGLLHILEPKTEKFTIDDPSKALKSSPTHQSSDLFNSIMNLIPLLMCIFIN